ncbi:hypothetical protein BC831DRAFT_476341 [Entophlyctis helioformis]|nr:hypothetical protein BC831DRAFT_476341 [Entophlyctis helioformis]
MFLISRETVSPHHANFNVLGSTGNVYSVRIAHTVDCNCPDSNKGNLCKHVLFVMLKVLRCPRDDVRVFQRALLSSELEDLFANAPQAPTDMANVAVQMLFKTAHGEAVEDDTSAVAQQDDGYVKQRPISADAPDDCAICYESMTAADQAAGKLDWCRAQCGNSYHKECIDNWIEHARRTRSDVTCAFCRSKWISRDAPKGGAAGGAASAEGYINLASVQGLSTRRDTSTYNHGYNGYKRRRWW